MPARKSPDGGTSDSAAENIPPPAEKVPMVSRADVAGVSEGVAPAKTPLADDQEEVTLKDGQVVVVDKAYAEAMRQAEGKATGSVKQYPPGAEPAAGEADAAPRGASAADAGTV